MNELAAALEARALAQFLKTSRWVYPLVNAGHILGIALLIGSVVPMDLRLLGLRHRPGLDETVRLLRPVAVAGLVLAAACGVLLFITQAGDYCRTAGSAPSSRWWRSPWPMRSGTCGSPCCLPRGARFRPRPRSCSGRRRLCSAA